MVLLGLVASAAATAALAAVMLPRLELAGLRRPNYRGREIATGVGVLLLAGLLAGTAVLALAETGGDLARMTGAPGSGGSGALTGQPAAAGSGGLHGPPRAPAGGSPVPPVQLLTAVAVAALVGLMDDLLGDPVRGWRGHLGQAARGHFTGGQMKVLLLGMASLVLVPAAGAAGRLLAAAVMAGTANALNLLDRRPGRALKAFLLGWLGLAATVPAAALELLPVAGAALVLLPLDLGERAMLGDAGSNALGAALGWALAAHLAPVAQGTALAVLVALHLLAEYRSLTELIEAVPPLRWLDSLGRG